MLDKIRKRTHSMISTFLVILVAVVMTFWGVDRMNRGKDDSGGSAALVNGEMISRRDFILEFQNRVAQYQKMMGPQFDERMISALQIPQRTLDELIHAKLIAQQAQKLGMIVPDAELADFIQKLPEFQRNGKFYAEGYLKIPNRGLEEGRFRERLRFNKFQSYFSHRIRLTPADLIRAYEVRETKVNLDYAKIDFTAIANSAPIGAKEMKAYLKKTSENDLQKFYHSHRKDFTDPAQVQLRQIRVSVPFQAKPEARTVAKSKIDAVRPILTPANFEMMAKTTSDDDYAKKGGNAGWVKRGALEATLDQALDKLAVNQISDVIETQFGYFILQIVAKKEPYIHPYEEVKKISAEKAYREEFRKKFSVDKKTEWDKMLAEGKSIEADLKKYKVEIKPTLSFSLGSGFIPNIGQVEPVLDAVFDLTPEKPLAKRLFPFQDHYFFIKLKSVERPSPDEFAKKSDALEKGVSTSLQTELITQWISTLQKNASVKIEIGI